ncbi:preprotein translocase subunit SecE [Wolbachia endosymbiont of Pentidionis agamae]|uniref:preprotein translocase subunit SecE n=1 Tax=Wolbachia endosymbiont of Pentidionis agamae TaxID=3110435 RepID=UPI0038CD71C0
MLRILNNFFYSLRQEVLTISWVGKKEVFSSFIIVLIAVLCFSTFFCLVDFLFINVIKWIFKAVYGV